MERNYGVNFINKFLAHVRKICANCSCGGTNKLRGYWPPCFARLSRAGGGRGEGGRGVEGEREGEDSHTHTHTHTPMSCKARFFCLFSMCLPIDFEWMFCTVLYSMNVKTFGNKILKRYFYKVFLILLLEDKINIFTQMC